MMDMAPARLVTFEVKADPLAFASQSSNAREAKCRA